MNATIADYIVWIDCEMTGLDIDVDGLTEIAVLITDYDLRVLDEGIDIVIHPGEAALEQMSDFVRTMHENSGLLAEIRSGVSVSDAEEQVLSYIASSATGPGRPLVAGNTIGMDRRFISKFMPKLDQVLHYRSIDVSTIKELSRHWYESAFRQAPVKQGGHRALADIAESIQELAYFRDAVFVPAPGPDRDAAKALATQALETYAPHVNGASTESE